MTQLVDEMMAANPAFLLPNDTCVRAAQLMVQEDCGLLPIIDNADTRLLVGVITDRDIVVRLIANSKNPLEAKVSEAMSGEVKSLPTTASLSEAADLMQSAQIHRVIITDADDKLVGVLSLADVATQGLQPRMIAATVQSISRTDTNA